MLSKTVDFISLLLYLNTLTYLKGKGPPNKGRQN